MSRNALTEDERVIVAALTTFCLSVLFEDERRTLLGLIAHHLPHVRRVPPLSDLVRAAEQFQDAKTPLEWTFAKSSAGRALVPVLRNDLVGGTREVAR
jgi:hypothetical protein